jgi:hypothetical protein
MKTVRHDLANHYIAGSVVFAVVYLMLGPLWATAATVFAALARETYNLYSRKVRAAAHALKHGGWDDAYESWRAAPDGRWGWDDVMWTCLGGAVVSMAATWPY